MGYLRIQPPDTTTALRAQTARALSRLMTEAEIADHLDHVPDPFCVEITCPQSPTGAHQAIVDCGDVVCPHCANVLP